MFSLCWRGGEAKDNSCVRGCLCSLSWGSESTFSVILSLRKPTKLEHWNEKLTLNNLFYMSSLCVKKVGAGVVGLNIYIFSLSSVVENKL